MIQTSRSVIHLFYLPCALLFIKNDIVNVNVYIESMKVNVYNSEQGSFKARHLVRDVSL